MVGQGDRETMTQFEDLVIQNLDEIKTTIADIQTKTTDLCVRSTVSEKDIADLKDNWKSHINSEIQKELVKRENKWKITAVIFGSISAIATIVNYFR